MDLEQHIRSIPDFPKPGILFYDISTLLQEPAVFAAAVQAMAEQIAPYRPERLMAIESRGFIFGAALARHLDTGFGMIRKQGKLPGSTVAHAYALEYGADMIEISADLVPEGMRVVIVDDLIATGGTLAASVELLRKVGASVAATAVLIELDGLGGRARIDVPLERVLVYAA